METLLIGGGSFKNKAWVEELKAQLEPGIPTLPLIFQAWEQGESVNGLNFPLELDKALKIVGDQKFNLLCKSVGSILGMKILERIPTQVEKIIVCGFPLNDFTAEELEAYQVLKNFPVETILCFQNNADPHGSFEEAKSFIAAVNPDIKIVEKIADSHDYPYFQDFKDFLLA